MKIKNEAAFAKQMGKDLTDILPVADARFETQKKAQSALLCFRSVAAGKDGTRASIELDLTPSYQQFRVGVPYVELLKESIEDARNQLEHKLAADPIDRTLLDRWETAKDMIVMELVNNEYFGDELDSIPHRDLGTASIIYRAVFQHGYFELDGCLITDREMERYHITPEQLHQQALISTPKLCPAVFIAMTDQVTALTAAENGCGAAVAFYPGILERCVKMMDGNFYMMVPNVHEIILARDGGDERQIRMMCTFFSIMQNRICAEEEQLACRLYYYDAAAHTLKLLE